MNEGTLELRLLDIRERIKRAALRSGRNPDDIRLVAVVKQAQVAQILEILRLGVKELGENRLQPALDRRDQMLALSPYAQSTARWHFIGPLQKNKIARAVQLFSVFQSVESVDTARALAQHLKRAEKPAEVFVQVNVSGEAQQHGVAPEALGGLLDAVRNLPELQLRGLMALGLYSENLDEIRRSFERLRGLRDKSADCGEHLELSMGMSGDFEIAIEEGSNWVRLGRSLFES